MPSFERAGVSLYYEEFGAGHPLLLFAPGGMRSRITSGIAVRLTRLLNWPPISA